MLINNNQKFYIQDYKKSDLKMRQASWRNEIIASSPRFGMEAIGISIVSILLIQRPVPQEELIKFYPY